MHQPAGTRGAQTHDRVVKLKIAWHNGTTHIVLEAMEFIQRLVALVPRPPYTCPKFHGVLVPNATLRSRAVPKGEQATAQPRAHQAHRPPVHMRLKRAYSRACSTSTLSNVRVAAS